MDEVKSQQIAINLAIIVSIIDELFDQAAIDEYLRELKEEKEFIKTSVFLSRVKQERSRILRDYNRYIRQLHAIQMILDTQQDIDTIKEAELDYSNNDREVIKNVAETIQHLSEKIRQTLPK